MGTPMNHRRANQIHHHPSHGHYGYLGPSSQLALTSDIPPSLLVGPIVDSLLFRRGVHITRRYFDTSQVTSNDPTRCLCGDIVEHSIHSSYDMVQYPPRSATPLQHSRPERSKPGVVRAMVLHHPFNLIRIMSDCYFIYVKEGQASPDR